MSKDQQAAQADQKSKSGQKAARSGRRDPFTERQIAAALGLIGVFTGAMVAWSSLAPLGSAVIAPGVVAVESHRRAIQHLEGGIVGQILVKDGAVVQRGDVLIELRDVAIAANVERLWSQYFEATAAVARLSAERDGLPEIDFTETLARAGEQDAQARGAIAAQRKIFTSRQGLREQRLSVLDKRIDRLRDEISGLKSQMTSLDQQIAVTQREEKDAEELFDKRLLRKSRLMDVQRDRAKLEERRSGLQSSLAQAEQQISEVELRKSELDGEILAEIVEELRTRQARAREISREIIAAEDILQRSRIRSPIDGTVVGLQIHSRDGVISPGQTLMEIVPLSDNLVVEARVRPEDIQEVRGGLPANVVLNTPTRRYSQPIQGAIESVSADRLVDKLTGRPFYGVRIALDPASIDPNDTKLLAGMSADVFIQTGDRTPMAYLAAPLMRTINRGMREN